MGVVCLLFLMGVVCLVFDGGRLSSVFDGGRLPSFFFFLVGAICLLFFVESVLLFLIFCIVILSCFSSFCMPDVFEGSLNFSCSHDFYIIWLSNILT